MEESTTKREGREKLPPGNKVCPWIKPCLKAEMFLNFYDELSFCLHHFGLGFCSLVGESALSVQEVQDESLQPGSKQCPEQSPGHPGKHGGRQHLRGLCLGPELWIRGGQTLMCRRNMWRI